jgi:hypothetical protein
MAIEESSVVAAASIRLSSGRLAVDFSNVLNTEKIGQVHFIFKDMS